MSGHVDESQPATTCDICGTDQVPPWRFRGVFGEWTRFCVSCLRSLDAMIHAPPEPAPPPGPPTSQMTFELGKRVGE